MTDSIIVPEKYRHECIICGSPAVEQHHVIYGTGGRKVSDQEGLIIPLCHYHHSVFAHNTDGKHEMESKCIQMMGEWCWIANDLMDFIQNLGGDITSKERMLEVEKEKFRELFGKSLF